MKSKVKWFNKNKGYGFIKNPDSPDRDIFVHFTAIKDKGYRVLEQGDEVEFDLIQTFKGFQAFNVKKIGESQQTSKSVASDGLVRPMAGASDAVHAAHFDGVPPSRRWRLSSDITN